MARKAAPKTSKPVPSPIEQPYYLPNEAPWGGFVNIRLSDEQREEFSSWYAANAAHFPSTFDDMLGSGLKATFSYDAEHECYILALQGALMGSSPGDRFVSTSRAGTLNEVIALSVWKHDVLCRGDYGNYRPKDSTFMKWG